MILTSLCYLEQDDCYLMLHRVKKKNDANHDKWIGVGGKFEEGESPEDCVKRETLEETGLTLTSWKFRGIITFAFEGLPSEYMHLFTADGFTGTLKDCDEGTLEWVPKSRIPQLPIWKGDLLFFRLLAENAPFFSLKLNYRNDGTLVSAELNGQPTPID